MKFCASCFIPADGRRPGCDACKHRDLYQRRKEQRPAEHAAYVALKTVECARRRGGLFTPSFAVELRAHRTLAVLQERRAA